MATIELHLTGGQVLRQSGAAGPVMTIRDTLSKVIEAGGAVNLNETDADRVTVVNSVHILYAVVTP